MFIPPVVPELPLPKLPGLPTGPKFELGQVVATPAAIELLSQCAESALDIICRHANGDWGDLDACDMRANAEALVSGARLMSAYTVLAAGTPKKVWVITDATGDDGRRLATTLLLPGDY